MVFIVDVESRRFTGAEGGVVGELPHGTSITLTTADDEIVSPSVGTIRFFPDGSSTGGGLAILRRPDRYDVLVDWLTGGVSIYERKATAR
jgi:general secretion pathway protein H